MRLMTGGRVGIAGRPGGRGVILAVAAVLAVMILPGCARRPAGKPLPIEQRFTITAEKFQFVPGTIQVAPAKRVGLRLKSNDVTYGFAIPALNLRTVIPAKGETTLQFTPSRKGSFVFRCTPPGPQPGCRQMRGMLIVK